MLPFDSIDELCFGSDYWEKIDLVVSMIDTRMFFSYFVDNWSWERERLELFLNLKLFFGKFVDSWSKNYMIVTLKTNKQTNRYDIATDRENLFCGIRLDFDLMLGFDWIDDLVYCQILFLWSVFVCSCFLLCFIGGLLAKTWSGSITIDTDMFVASSIQLGLEWSDNWGWEREKSWNCCWILTCCI